MKPIRLDEIASVGMELEGGYCEECIDPLIDEYKSLLHIVLKSDGSVLLDTPSRCPHSYTENGYNDRYNESWMEEGEITLWTEMRNLLRLYEFIDRLFKSHAFKQNSSCGNHIHVKFVKSDKWRTFTSHIAWLTFIQKYKSSFRKSAKYLDRLHNSYCHSSWEPQIEREGRCWDRYKMINFESLHERPGVLEFRILPHYRTSQEAQHASLTLLNIVNNIAKSGPQP